MLHYRKLILGSFWLFLERKLSIAYYLFFSIIMYLPTTLHTKWQRPPAFSVYITAISLTNRGMLLDTLMETQVCASRTMTTSFLTALVFWDQAQCLYAARVRKLSHSRTFSWKSWQKNSVAVKTILIWAEEITRLCAAIHDVSHLSYMFSSYSASLICQNAIGHS